MHYFWSNSRLSFDDSTEELSVHLLKLRLPKLRSILDLVQNQDQLNPSVEVRVMPSDKGLEASSTDQKMRRSTKITQLMANSSFVSEVDLSFSGVVTFQLRSMRYNYHGTFVQLVLWHNERPSSSSMLLLPGVARWEIRTFLPGLTVTFIYAYQTRAERTFLAHALLALSDVHPIIHSLCSTEKGQRKERRRLETVVESR